MLVDNPYGILRGDTEDPQLIAYPRDGIPEVLSTIDALKEAGTRHVSIATETGGV